MKRLPKDARRYLLSLVKLEDEAIEEASRGIPTMEPRSKWRADFDAPTYHHEYWKQNSDSVAMLVREAEARTCGNSH